MGFFIGVLAVLLVLFMIAVMALAEWADKDPGDLFRMFFSKRPAPAPEVHDLPAQPVTVKPVKSAKSVKRTVAVSITRGSSTRPRTQPKKAKRKAK